MGEGWGAIELILQPGTEGLKQLLRAAAGAKNVSHQTRHRLCCLLEHSVAMHSRYCMLAMLDDDLMLVDGGPDAQSAAANQWLHVGAACAAGAAPPGGCEGLQNALVVLLGLRLVIWDCPEWQTVGIGGPSAVPRLNWAFCLCYPKAQAEHALQPDIGMEQMPLHGSAAGTGAGSVVPVGDDAGAGSPATAAAVAGGAAGTAAGAALLGQAWTGEQRPAPTPQLS